MIPYGKITATGQVRDDIDSLARQMGAARNHRAVIELPGPVHPPAGA